MQSLDYKRCRRVRELDLYHQVLGGSICSAACPPWWGAAARWCTARGVQVVHLVEALHGLVLVVSRPFSRSCTEVAGARAASVFLTLGNLDGTRCRLSAECGRLLRWERSSASWRNE